MHVNIPVYVFWEKSMSKSTYKNMNAKMLGIHILLWCHLLSFYKKRTIVKDGDPSKWFVIVIIYVALSCFELPVTLF